MLWLWLLACRPPVPEVRLTPSPATTAADLEVRPAPGIGERRTYQWAVDGEVQLGLVDDVIPAERLSRGQRWTVDVVAWQGGRSSKPRQLAARIGNGAPEAQVVIDVRPDGLHAVVWADDPDDDPVTTRVEWTVDGELQSQLEGVGPSKLTAGDEWTVTAWAHDGSVEGLPATASVVIDAVPPVLTTAAITPDPPDAATELALTVTPPPSNDQQLVAEWSIDGEFVASGATLAAGVATRGDIVSARVWVADDDVLSVPVDAPPVRVANSPPTLTGAVITPPTLAEGVIARCEPLGFVDADGDPPQIDVRWFVDFLYVGRGEVLSSADFDRGQTVRCEARPVDPEAIGPAALSQILEVVNTAPTLADVVLSPEQPVTGDTVSAAVLGVYDADFDDVDLQLTWFVDGTEVGTGEVLPVPIVDGDQLLVEAQPFDGTDVGVVVPSVPTTVGNAPPSLSQIRYLPDPPRAGEPLTVDYDVVDPEGDGPIVVLSRFDVDGVAIEGDSIEAGVLLAGQEVFVELQATDPYGAAPIVQGPTVTVAP